jgi:hypothetical protein
MFCTSFAQHASHQIGVWLHYKHFHFCFFGQHLFRGELLVAPRSPADVIALHWHI